MSSILFVIVSCCFRLDTVRSSYERPSNVAMQVRENQRKSVRGAPVPFLPLVSWLTSKSPHQQREASKSLWMCSLLENPVLSEFLVNLWWILFPHPRESSFLSSWVIKKSRKKKEWLFRHADSAMSFFFFTRSAFWKKMPPRPDKRRAATYGAYPETAPRA